MDHHLEVELKWMLTPDGHARLVHALPGLLGAARLLLQDNRFFDSADLRLRRARMNLRLRRENDQLQLTCKRRASGGDAQLHRHDEWERWLDPALWARLPVAGAALEPAVVASLDLPEPVAMALAGAPLLAYGGFANARQEFRSPAGELLCLDRTTYNAGRCDYELEIETPDPAASVARWSGKFAELGIPVKPQPLTKFARFVALMGG
jgi:uncharacterized protein YjbK